MSKIYVCPTPLGNLEDMTFRVIDTLKNVDFIAAEDTRHSIKLLNHFDINTSMISYHEHNEQSRAEEIIDRVKKGENCALISDAGMPGISDPGQILIKKAIEEEVEIEVVPGGSAFLLALVASGFNIDRFVFEGFLPRKSGEKRERLKELKEERRTLILYEAPHRILTTLKDIREVFGEREVSISREITKKFEEHIRGVITVVIDKLNKGTIKGEFVLVLKGYDGIIEEKEEISIEEQLKIFLEEGHSKKEAVKLTAKKLNARRNEVYQKSLEI
ncbi:MAG: 16S rRNA (cytidine(1402)-2'-O)-methyltransferase [Bacillota bacterium]|nr:16S rRNA (cytidine(1402)-2'-O)-methyltransferase [Bacillota bacterium]